MVKVGSSNHNRSFNDTDDNTYNVDLEVKKLEQKSYSYNLEEHINEEGDRDNVNRWRNHISTVLLLSLLLSSFIAYANNSRLQRAIGEAHNLHEKIDSIMFEMSVNESDLKATKNNIIAIKDVLKASMTNNEHDQSNHDISDVLDTIMSRNNAKIERLLALEKGISDIHRRELDLQ